MNAEAACVQLGQFSEQAEGLRTSLDQLGDLVNQLEGVWQAESTQRGGSATQDLRRYFGDVATHATSLEAAFTRYADALAEAQTRMPLPLSDPEADARVAQAPGLLASVTEVTDIIVERHQRTEEARRLYARVIEAALEVESSTPPFAAIGPTTTDEAGVTGTYRTTGTPMARWPNSDTGLSSRATADSSPHPGNGTQTTMPTPPPVVSAPVPTPGAGSGGGGGLAAPVPSVPPTPPGGDGSRPGLPLPPVGMGDAGRTGRSPAGPGAGADGRARPSGRAGGGPGAPLLEHDTTSRGPARGYGPVGGRVGGFGAGMPIDDAAASQMGRSRGASGGAGSGGFGPMGAGGRSEEDRERRRPSYLEAADDPNDLFGNDVLVAPPVLGELPTKRDF